MKVLVTGASKGIGRALVRELIGLGHEVWGVARSVAALSLLKEELGESFSYTAADLAQKEGIDALLAALRLEGFVPEQVFLVAGIYSTADSTFSSAAHQKSMMDCNYHGTVMLFEALRSHMPTPRVFVLVSSVFALLGDELNPSYAEAKAKASEYILAQHDENVKVVYLGPVNTSINQYARKSNGLGVVEPYTVAPFLASAATRAGRTLFFPVTAWLFYGLFRFLPKKFYTIFMRIARR